MQLYYTVSNLYHSKKGTYANTVIRLNKVPDKVFVRPWDWKINIKNNMMCVLMDFIQLGR